MPMLQRLDDLAPSEWIENGRVPLPGASTPVMVCHCVFHLSFPGIASSCIRSMSILKYPTGP